MEEDGENGEAPMRSSCARFPIDDGLGIYCWFCAELLDTRPAQGDTSQVGWGRYRVQCGACRRITHFDRLSDLEEAVCPSRSLRE